MSTPWQINAGVQRVELKDGRAEVAFTVSNPGPVDGVATVEVVGSEQTAASWFSVAEPQRLVPHGGSVTFPAVLRPPLGAPAGSHWLSGRVYSADAAPEETAVLSDRVVFELGETKPPPPSKTWLWILIAVALVAVVGGVVAFLLLKGDDGPTKIGEEELTLSQGAGVDIDTISLASLEESDAAEFSYGLIEGGFVELMPQFGQFPDVTPSGDEIADAVACKEAAATRSVVQFGPGETPSFCVRSEQGRVAVVTVTQTYEQLKLGVRIATYEFPEES